VTFADRVGQQCKRVYFQNIPGINHHFKRAQQVLFCLSIVLNMYIRRVARVIFGDIILRPVSGCCYQRYIKFLVAMQIKKDAEASFFIAAVTSAVA
jgi:hypothetical protein